MTEELQTLSGIRTLMRVVNDALSAHPMSELLPRGCLIISIDATGRQMNEARKPLSAAAALLRGHRRNVLELAGIPAAQQDVAMFGTFEAGLNGVSGTCRIGTLRCASYRTVIPWARA